MKSLIIIVFPTIYSYIFDSFCSVSLDAKLFCSCCHSVTQSRPTLCHPMYCSTRGLPVPHHFLKSAQVHVHCIGDAIQPSHPLTPSFPSALNLSQSFRVFSNEFVLHIRWPKYWSFTFSINPSNEYSGLIALKINWFDLLAVQGDSRESSTAPQFEGISSLMLCLLLCLRVLEIILAF